VDDAHFHQVAVLFGLGVEAELGLVRFQHLADHDRAFDARVFRDLTDRSLQGAADDVDAGVLIGVVALQTVQHLGGLQQGHAAARDDAFIGSGAGRVQGVVDAVLLFLHFDFGRAADAQDGDAAGQLGQTLLQFFLVVVRGGVLDLTLDLRDAGFDALFLAGAFDEGGVVLGDRDLLGLAEHVERDRLKLDAEVFRDDLAARQDGDVFQHGLAAVAEARSLDGGDAQAAAQLVDHQGGQGFAFDVLGDDQQGTARLNHGFQHRQHGLQRGQLLLVEQDERLFEGDLHLVRVGDEIGRQVAAVELHAFDDVDGGFGGLGFFNRDDAFVADLGHGLGAQVADFSVAVGRGGAALGDFSVAVGRDGADLGDFRVVGDRLGVRLDLFQHRFDSLVDAALQVHRVHAGGHGLQAFLNDGLGQDGGGGGAVARLVVRLGSDF